MKSIFATTLVFILFSAPTFAQKDKDQKDNSKITSSLVSGLSFRCIGPALTAGRIADIAMNPNNQDEYYLAVASGGVWKTSNHGNTYEPIFDGQGSNSIGCVTIDPSNTNTVWVGSGENHNQRSVGYGDGVYKSLDGGKSWKNMGLKNSEHIGKIIVHPENSDIVFVAAYGPLWSEGGDRGVYKTTDGGENWEKVLYIDEHTGISDLEMDPTNPDVIFACAHQRRRHVFTYVSSGPGSGLHKSVDGGETWTEIKKGLPTSNMGRLAISISPADHNYVYILCEAENDKQGVYRSTNRGENFSKMSDYLPGSPGNYYLEIFCDPLNKDKFFSMNTWLHHTEDGGKTIKMTGEKQKHVDNHAIWINPNNTDHFIVGCDGGVYETWDHAKNWHYKQNLPITQFYKVAVDNDYPFYNVYGGTQDNNSIGGPSRVTKKMGINNSDWFITNGGDGFESQIDPKDPNIVYAQAQYGWLVRYDKKSGEKIGIQPMPGKGEPAYRWNWDAPLVISKHDNKRIYFAANKVFKSDDQGNSWQTISPDLSRLLDRNQMKVMGEIQSPDVAMKHKSTTMFGNIVALDESKKNEQLLYAGTDDGLVHITKDGGANWTKKESFPGVPSMTYVNMLLTSQHEEATVYAVFNNHKKGDFKPYVLKSTNSGDSWVSIAGDLPERGSVYAIAEDHVNPNLLFAGTEFGVFFTLNGGKNWIQLSAGLPTVAVRDIAIQERENDLVLGTFGRSFYVLDDYSALRTLSEKSLEAEASIFPVKTALQFIESTPHGNSQGASLYMADNPAFGATFTYYIKESPKSLKSQRQKDEAAVKKEGGDIKYPSNEDLKKEDLEEDAYLIFIIRDASGNEVRKIKSGHSQGIHRVTWNLRHPSTNPIKLSKGKVGRYSYPDEGPLVVPGDFTVELYENVEGQFKKLVEPVGFKVKALENTSIARQTEANIAFKNELAELRRKYRGISKIVNTNTEKVKYFEAAIQQYPGADLAWMKEVKEMQTTLHDINIMLWGDWHKSKRDIETLDGAANKLETIVYQSWYSTSDPTTTQKQQYEISKEEFVAIDAKVKAVQAKVAGLEEKLNAAGVPYTPNRQDFKED